MMHVLCNYLEQSDGSYLLLLVKSKLFAESQHW